MVNKVKKRAQGQFKTIDGTTPPGKFILAYGEPGSYKTTTFGHAPDVLYITTSDERGIIDAIEVGVVPVKYNDVVVLPPLSEPGNIPSSGGHPAWQLLTETLSTFLHDTHDKRTVVIDTASGLQSVCHQHCASMLFNGDMNDERGFMSFQAGYLKAAEQFWNGEFLQLCNQITSLGKNVVLICHSSIMNVPNLGGAEYECYAPSLIKGAKKENIYDYTLKTVSAILYFGTQTILSTTDRKSRVASQHGFIGVKDAGWYKAKNWYDLRDEIDMGNTAKETWGNLNSKLPIN